MACERVLLTECSFDDTNTTYISTWNNQELPKDCIDACEKTTLPVCHFWMHNSSNKTCTLYERDKRNCHTVGGPASLTASYCTGMKTNKQINSLQFFHVVQ